MGGPEMAPQPPNVRRAPAKPWRSSIPQTPERSERPGKGVALLDYASSFDANPRRSVFSVTTRVSTNCTR
jgi:hypothetical protein